MGGSDVDKMELFTLLNIVFDISLESYECYARIICITNCFYRFKSISVHPSKFVIDS